MKAMKKFIALICAAVMLMSFPVCISHADDDIDVYLNGYRIYFEDQQPVIVDGRTLVPMRAVFEAMGAEVKWFGQWNYVDIYCADNMNLRLFVNRNIDYISFFTQNSNGTETSLDKKIYLDVEAQIINDRTMVPLRAVSETMGAQVDWDGDSRSVYIWYDNDEIDRNLNSYKDRHKYYSEYWTNILNFETYIDETPYDSEHGRYIYDYSNYNGDIDDIIYSYVTDMDNSGYSFTESYTDGSKQYYIMEGDVNNVRLMKDDETHDIEILVYVNLGGSSDYDYSTPKPTTVPTSKPVTTPKPTSEPTPKPIETETPAPTIKPVIETPPAAFDYLKDMGYESIYKDSNEDSISSVSSNAVRFVVKTSKNKNPNLSKGDECKMSVEYDLDAKYSRLTGELKGGGALRVYCDGVLKLTTPKANSPIDIDLNISGCRTLKLEAFGTVEGLPGYWFGLNINEARLWYE